MVDFFWQTNKIKKSNIKGKYLRLGIIIRLNLLYNADIKGIEYTPLIYK